MVSRNFKAIDLDQAITTCFLITPNDSADLSPFAAGLRIWNPNANASTVAIETVNGDSVTITVPASALTIEPLYVAKVKSTGTTAGLIIHGYTI